MWIPLRPTCLIVAAGMLLLPGCATSPTGRSQLKLFPEQQVQSMGIQAYDEMKQKQPTVDNTQVTGYVDCVAHAITQVVPGTYGKSNWEVTVFRSDEVNAFALPGAKIGVYSGLLKVAQTQGQLAAVIGHEVGHVLAGHANERLSTAFATQSGLEVISVLTGSASPMKQQALALLGLGAQVGIILPFSRAQESEADEIGEQLMAKAGFDPHQSIALWENMSKAGGKSPPQFLSTHPSPSNRIQDLRNHLPKAMQLYQRAHFEGRNPQCTPPPASQIPTGK